MRREPRGASVEPAPRQGFECEGERASGTVHPPGGAELVASAAEIVGELAKAGLSTGERLLKDLALAPAALLSDGAAAGAHRAAQPRLAVYCRATPSRRDPGRGGRGTQCGSKPIRWGESAQQGRSAARSAARARQLTP